MLEAVMAENGNPPAIRAGHKLMRYGQSGCPGTSVPGLFISLDSPALRDSFFFGLPLCKLFVYSGNNPVFPS